MKTFCKLTAQSPAASYVPLPRFLLQDEALRDISNDAKVLYALLLDRASISRQNGSPLWSKLISLPHFQQFPDLGLPCFQLGNIVLVNMPGVLMRRQIWLMLVAILLTAAASFFCSV